MVTIQREVRPVPETELDAIAAAAIGGALLMDGKGSILGATRNGLTNVRAFHQRLATDLIIPLVMRVDRATRGRS